MVDAKGGDATVAPTPTMGGMAMTDPLLTYMGEPVEPHEVPYPEFVQVVCSKCGHDVDMDGEVWYHVDAKYEPQEDTSWQ
jgi:hypothetical protein